MPDGKAAEVVRTHAAAFYTKALAQSHPQIELPAFGPLQRFY
jgi:hypothetical protein